MNISIEPAQREDLSAILALLEACGLPQEGFDEHINTALVAREGSDIVGSAALEVYGSVALLRSVAVAPARRGQGLGEQLTRAALALAQEQGIASVYLLTETAQHFFPRFGFSPIARDAVSPALHQSKEWTSACPVTAQAMVTRLTGECLKEEAVQPQLL